MSCVPCSAESAAPDPAREESWSVSAELELPPSMSANEIGVGVALGVCVGVALRLGLNEGEGVWLADAVARTVLETELLRDGEAVVDALAVGLPDSLTVLVGDGDELCVVVAEELAV